MRKLAPIGVSVYCRVDHLKEAIEALKKNSLARESELYVFSDGPKKGDEELISNVREYIHSIDGFKKTHIIERETNGRIANSRGGIKQLLNEYGKIIYLEDDVVTAPGFLQFINDALDFYENNDRILSITGYCPPIEISERLIGDAFILKRFSGWGFATWMKKFDPFGFLLSEHGIEDFLCDKKSIKEFIKNGEDMYQMLLSEYNDEIDALDVRIMYYEYKYNMFTVYPSKSLVQNIGHDSSGVHCDTNNKFHHKELWSKTDDFEFVKDIKVNEDIRKKNYSFRRGGIKGMAMNFTKNVGIYHILKKLKNKLL